MKFPARTAVIALSVTAVTAVSGFVVGTPTAAAAPTAAAPAPADLQLVQTLSSLTGTHAYYDQTFKGLPVVDGYWASHVATNGAATVADGRLAVPADLSVTPSVAVDQAARAGLSAGLTAAARSGTRPKVGGAKDVTADGSATLAVWASGGPARLVWRVPTQTSTGTAETFVDARTGATVASRDVSKSEGNRTGTGQVFYPNPVVTLRDESLENRHNSDYPALAAAYKTVSLPRLDSSGHLTGDWAQVIVAKGGLATSASGSFVYTRDDPRFEQVNAYYGVTKAQGYLHDLGFTDVNNEAQDLAIDTKTFDNSFYDPRKDRITYGTGGVDDAEDQEVVWHEYGHAIQDAVVPHFGRTLEAGSIGEGFGDYWAVTMSIPSSNGFQLPCVMDWDSTSYTSGPVHCLRRTDTGKTTDDIEGEVHADGEIWSQALWDLNRKLGRDRADKVVIESTFYYTADTSFASAARQVVATAKALYGQDAAAVARQAFKDRKIL